jgi:hypothetical protein
MLSVDTFQFHRVLCYAGGILRSTRAYLRAGSVAPCSSDCLCLVENGSRGGRSYPGRGNPVDV